MSWRWRESAIPWMPEREVKRPGVARVEKYFITQRRTNASAESLSRQAGAVTVVPELSAAGVRGASRPEERKHSRGEPLGLLHVKHVARVFEHHPRCAGHVAIADHHQGWHFDLAQTTDGRGGRDTLAVRVDPHARVCHRELAQRRG